MLGLKTNVGTGPLALWEVILADVAEAEFIEVAVH
jgi:hypothetical protein